MCIAEQAFNTVQWGKPQKALENHSSGSFGGGLLDTMCNLLIAVTGFSVTSSLLFIHIGPWVDELYVYLVSYI